MSKEVCKIFLKIDDVFKNGKPNLEKINKFDEYTRACPIDNRGVQVCKDDLAGIDALYSRLFNDLFQLPLDIRNRENNDNQYAEYVMMWLSFRLFHAESYTSSTLMDFYNKYLKNTHRPFNYNDLIEKKKHLLYANLDYMSRLYSLFNEICFITLKYSANYYNANIIKKDYTKLYNKYKSLYDDINECDSYLNLLNNLKRIYDNFKNSLIRSGRSRQRGSQYVNFKNLTPTKQAKKKYTPGFNCEKCKKVDSKAKQKKIKPGPKAPKPKPEAPPPPPSETQQAPMQQLQPQPVISQSSPTTQKSPEAPSEKIEPPSPSLQESQKSETPPTKPASSTSPPPLAPQPQSPSEPTLGVQTGSPDSQGISDPTVNQLSNQENISQSSDSDQHNTEKKMEEQKGNISHKPEQSQDGQRHDSNSKKENTKDDPPNVDNNLGSQDDGKEGSNIEPQNPPIEQKDQSITQGNSPKQQKNSGNMKLQNILDIFKNTFEMYRSPFYNTYTDIGNKLYEKASSTLESVYDKSRDFANNTINYVSEQLNKALENTQPINEKKPEPSPSLPGGEKKESQDIQTPTPDGQSKDNPQTPQHTQNFGSPDNKQMNPSDPLPEKQSQTSVDSSSKTPNLEIISKDLGINIEKNIPQLLKIKDIFKGYNRPETVITVILIPIISLIIYKYLSRERTKKSEKKNMKKVINLAYGKRKTQIIIKSCDRTKDLKPVINSVDRKKDSLLNIHKLMHADPIPFINLFFLLIFLSIKENMIFWNYKFKNFYFNVKNIWLRI